MLEPNIPILITKPNLLWIAIAHKQYAQQITQLLHTNIVYILCKN
ncbi:hypothetical protein SLEP1_g35886 [Rubroshorea leprosula]|uniref:Uncharacterized protein n=1 Tax=Rubroshorea leprosula TaxID=152421 RepID=A0AAV5KQ91_9ROSI|nr:hypothetical protein SLEP1_g35886 [Rubroshorea leprosula]